MGIITEYNPDLALRAFTECKRGNRTVDECVPEHLISDKTYRFSKRGQRNYWLEGEIPLVITKGNQKLSSPIASIRILEATHTLLHNVPWTKGTYKIIEVYPVNDKTIHFNGFAKI